MTEWMKSISPPKEIGPNEVLHYTSSSSSRDHLYFVLFYLKPLLFKFSDYFDPEFWDILYEYADIMQQCCNPVVEINNLKSLYNQITTFLTYCDQVLPDCCHPIYLHTMVHLPLQMYKWSSCIFFNCFSAERLIGIFYIQYIFIKFKSVFFIFKIIFIILY